MLTSTARTLRFLCSPPLLLVTVESSAQHYPFRDSSTFSPILYGINAGNGARAILDVLISKSAVPSLFCLAVCFSLCLAPPACAATLRDIDALPTLLNASCLYAQMPWVNPAPSTTSCNRLPLGWTRWRSPRPGYASLETLPQVAGHKDTADARGYA